VCLKADDEPFPRGVLNWLKTYLPEVIQLCRTSAGCADEWAQYGVRNRMGQHRDSACMLEKQPFQWQVAIRRILVQ